MDKLKFNAIAIEENKKLYNYILKMIRNKEEAEDVLQEVFLSFWKKIDSINDKTHLGYLYRTAYNKSLNRIKKLKKSKEFSVDSVEIFHPVEISNEDNDNLSEIVANSLKQLKPKESILLELQFFQKLSYAEISERLGLSISAVDSRLFRAKQKLKKIILQEKRPTDV